MKLITHYCIAEPQPNKALRRKVCLVVFKAVGFREMYSITEVLEKYLPF